MFDVYLFTAIIFALCIAVALLVMIRVNNSKKSTTNIEDEEDDFQSMVTQINMTNYSKPNNPK